MGKMAQLLHTIRTLFSTKKKPEMIGCDGEPIFDKRYKIIIKKDYTSGYLDMLEWINTNSNDSVEVRFNNIYGQEGIYIGFENSDDALFFKIKYSI